MGRIGESEGRGEQTKWHSNTDREERTAGADVKVGRSGGAPEPGIRERWDLGRSSARGTLLWRWEGREGRRYRGRPASLLPLLRRRRWPWLAGPLLPPRSLGRGGRPVARRRLSPPAPERAQGTRQVRLPMWGKGGGHTLGGPAASLTQRKWVETVRHMRGKES